MKKEQWKDVKDFEGLYQVSNLGRVRSLDRYVRNNLGKMLKKGKIMKPFVNGSGYLQIKLSKEGEGHLPYLHKLVAEVFVDNPLNLKEVNHIDHDKSNCNYSNLEWCTRQENMIKSHEFYGTARGVNTCECGEEIHFESKQCLKCLGLKNRKTTRPSKEELSVLIHSKSFLQIGRDYGVSDNAVRRWCKDYGLPYRKKDLRLANR